MSIERRRRIEEILVEEFRAAGHEVVMEAGAPVALVKEYLLGEDTTILSRHDLSRLAEQIDGRLW